MIKFENFPTEILYMIFKHLTFDLLKMRELSQRFNKIIKDDSNNVIRNLIEIYGVHLTRPTNAFKTYYMIIHKYPELLIHYNPSISILQLAIYSDTSNWLIDYRRIFHDAINNNHRYIVEILATIYYYHFTARLYDIDHPLIRMIKINNTDMFKTLWKMQSSMTVEYIRKYWGRVRWQREAAYKNAVARFEYSLNPLCLQNAIIANNVVIVKLILDYNKANDKGEPAFELAIARHLKNKGENNQDMIDLIEEYDSGQITAFIYEFTFNEMIS